MPRPAPPLRRAKSLLARSCAARLVRPCYAMNPSGLPGRLAFPARVTAAQPVSTSRPSPPRVLSCRCDLSTRHAPGQANTTSQAGSRYRAPHRLAPPRRANREIASCPACTTSQLWTASSLISTTTLALSALASPYDGPYLAVPGRTRPCPATATCPAVPSHERATAAPAHSTCPVYPSLVSGRVRSRLVGSGLANSTGSHRSRAKP